jgi:hypothetical protein
LPISTNDDERVVGTARYENGVVTLRIPIPKSVYVPLDVAVNQIAKEYNLPPSVAALRLFNEIRDYNKIGGLKRELSKLCQQIFVINGFFRKSK